MREILFATALADDHRPNASDNNMDDCFKLKCYFFVAVSYMVNRKKDAKKCHFLRKKMKKSGIFNRNKQHYHEK